MVSHNLRCKCSKKKRYVQILFAYFKKKQYFCGENAKMVNGK